MPINLFVVASPDDKSTEVLKNLPKEYQITGLSNVEENITDDVLSTAEVMFWCAGSEALFESIFPRMSSLKWIHSRSDGVEALMTKGLLAQSNVRLTNARGVYSWSLAEYAIHGMMHFAKLTPQLKAAQNAKTWQKYNVTLLKGKTLGVVGYGDIGQLSAKFAKTFGMRILAHRRNPHKSVGDGIADQVFGNEQLHEMLSQCDYVLAALPGTPNTRHFIGAAEFAAMKPTAVFLNLGRGITVHEDALISALQNKTISAAALDVFEVEPLPSSSPLYTMENVLLSPHCADQTATFLEESVQFFVENAERYVRGEVTLNEVDKQHGY